MRETAQPAHQNKNTSKPQSWLKIAIWTTILVIVFVIISHYDITEYLEPVRFVEYIQSFGVMAPLVFMVIMALAVVVSPIPSLPLDLAAGLAFGPLLGTVYAVIGAEIGAIVSFLIGRALGREVVARLLKSDVSFCEKCSDHHLVGFVFFARLLPVFSFDLVSYGAGLTRMSLKAFALATLAGMIPPTFALVYFGSSTFAADWVLIVLAVVLVVLFIVLPQLIMNHQSSRWVQIILGKKPELSEEALSMPGQAVETRDQTKRCSWCGLEEKE